MRQFELLGLLQAPASRCTVSPEHSKRVSHLMVQLTPRQQQVLQLYYGKGLTIPEIAARLGASRSSVSRSRASGVRRLETLLQVCQAAAGREIEDSNS